MGITIHYTGVAKSEKAVEQIMSIVMGMGAQRDWQGAIIHDPDGEILRPDWDRDASDRPPEFDTGSGWIDEYHGPVSIVVTHPGEGCESLRMCFGKDRRMDGFIKTQWGPIEMHVKVCEILREIKPHFRELRVQDEGGFWETGDLKALDEKRQFVHDATAELQAKLEAAEQKQRFESMYDFDQDEHGEDRP